MVKLDAKTGKMEWYYQQTPHDLYDWDFQDPPILLDAGGKELAIGAGKSGIVVAARRRDRQAGLEDGRSAPTTATTTTACWRCAAKARRSRPGTSSRARSAA